MSRGTLIIVIGIAVVLLAAFGVQVRLSMEGSATVGIDPDDPAQVALGSDVYARACASYHGVDLEGHSDWRRRRADGTYPAPPHDASSHTCRHANALLFDCTKRGELGITGTSAFVIGDGAVSGAVDYDALSGVVDATSEEQG